MTPTAILGAAVAFREQILAHPLVLSSGAISSLIEATAEVRARVGGREATGRSSMYLSVLWAWPDASISYECRLEAMMNLCRTTADRLAGLCGNEPAHPLELGLRLHGGIMRNRSVPPLVRALCASPFDAAIHDATGQALGINAFRFYETDDPLPCADGMLPGGACAAIRALISPVRRPLPAWLIVGKNDGFATDIEPWIRRRNYRCFKIKIMGRDLEEDVERTVQVYRWATETGIRRPRLAVDSNEGNPDAESVKSYLVRLREKDPDAFACLEYLEQPTHRDILTHPQDWRETSRLKPILLDEGLTGQEQMDAALEQGWSGLALKTCKGHSFALVAAAWARRHGMSVALQDLTNPGLALIHAAMFGARIPTINGTELNSPQFTPAANAPWLPRLAGLFEPHDGFHRLPETELAGLGSAG